MTDQTPAVARRPLRLPALLACAVALSGCAASSTPAPTVTRTVTATAEPDRDRKQERERDRGSDDASLTGEGDYEFEFADQTIDVHYANLAEDPATARVLVIMHGTGRTADSYRDAFVEAVEAQPENANVILLAPEFSDDDYEEAEDYQLGNLLDTKLRPTPPDEWSYSVISPMVRDAARRVGGSQERFSMFGHSAGGQFVHRYLAYAPNGGGRLVDAAVAANAGWYLWPDPDVAYPYGIGGSPAPVDLPTWLSTDMLVLLGEGDTVADENLRDTPEAMAQGPNRLERGRAFVRAGQQAADAAGVPFGWELRTVPGAEHDKAQMAPAALDYILSHQE